MRSARLTGVLAAALAAAALLTTQTGCPQKMAVQPSYRPQQESDFFADKRTGRPLIEGTVSRATLDESYDVAYDPHLRSGRKPGGLTFEQNFNVTGVAVGLGLKAMAPREAADAYYDTFPASVGIEKYENLVRGQSRFNIFCQHCHGRTGDGNGIVVQRGFTRPPNFHTDNSRGLAYQGIQVPLTKVPPGYVFSVISRGYGAMGTHAQQIPIEDRWYIAAYVKALQASQDPSILGPGVAEEEIKRARDRKPATHAPGDAKEPGKQGHGKEGNH